MFDIPIDRRRLAGACRFLAFALLSAAAFYLMEAYEHNPFAEVRALAQLFNMILFELIAWILYFVTGRMHWAIRFELALAAVFGLANHYVMLFRSTPLVPWDIYSIGTAASVAGNYDFTPGVRPVVVTLVFLVLIALAGLLKDTKREENSGEDGGKRPLRRFLRWPMAAGLTLVLCLFTSALQDEEFQIRNYLYPYLFTPVYMTDVNGMAVTFAMNLAYLVVDKPSGYDAAEARAVLLAYEEEQKEEGTAYPNLIVIMDEAFSDPAVLGGFETNQDYMPFVHELQQGMDNTVTGYLQVSVCGGNTANSEFEFLTGNTMAFLPGGSIPYQQYIKRQTPSLASYLASLGYQTYAQHPYYASGWERDEVYPLLGFADMDFIDDYANKSFVRSYVSDACDLRHVIETFEKKGEGPAFIFNVTMQNHGGYTEQFDNFACDVQADCGTDALNQYLSLLRLSDESLRGLVSYFEQVEEPTVIVFFGDHQPSDSVVQPIWLANGIDASRLSDEQQALRYQVPYVIWANYEIGEQTGEDMSLNYLGASVLERAGVPVDAYRSYLLELKESCPVIAASGERVSDALGESEKKELLQTYKKLQYYNLFDAEE